MAAGTSSYDNVLRGQEDDESSKNGLKQDQEEGDEIFNEPSVREGEGTTFRCLIVTVFLLFCVFRTLDRVFLNRVMKIMGPYGGTLMSLYWPIAMAFITTGFTGMYILKKRCYDHDSRYDCGFFGPLSPLSTAQGTVPCAVFYTCVFGALDQLNAAIQSAVQQFIPAALQPGLNNLVVPLVAAMSFCCLGTRFAQVHYIACIVIILANVTGIACELQEMNFTAAKDAHGNVYQMSSSTLGFMYAVYVIGVIPDAVSRVYKQAKLKNVDIDIMWAFFYQSWWQVLWGILFYTINWLPWPYSDLSPATLGNDLADGWNCLRGTNPPCTNTANHTNITSNITRASRILDANITCSANVTGDCVTTCSEEPAWLFFLIYLALNVVYNLCFLWLTKYLSALWSAIGAVLCGNLYGILNMFPFIAGKSAAIMPVEQWLELLYSSIGLWVYTLEDEKNKDGNSMYGVPDEGKTGDAASDPADDDDEDDDDEEDELP